MTMDKNPEPADAAQLGTPGGREAYMARRIVLAEAAVVQAAVEHVGAPTLTTGKLKRTVRELTEVRAAVKILRAMEAELAGRPAAEVLGDE